VTITKPAALPAGGCIELVDLTIENACPRAEGTSTGLAFKIRAKTTSDLSWRRSPDSFDAVFPSSGSLAGEGTTSVSLTDVVLADRVAFEAIDGSGRVVLRFTVRHR
jgi:hypothetical protein